MHIDLRDGLKDELDTPIKLRWALRAITISVILSCIITACFLGRSIRVELSERERVEQIMAAPTGYNLRRRFYDPVGKTVYGSYWTYCNTTITAGHVHAEMDGTPPDGALGEARYVPGAIDAAFYTEGWSCGSPSNPVNEQRVWIGGFVAGSDQLSVRRGTMYIKRSVSGSEGYNSATYIFIFDPVSLVDILGEPVNGGMSGGIVLGQDLKPVGILATQNSKWDSDGDGEAEHGSDVVGLLDAYNILIVR